MGYEQQFKHLVDNNVDPRSVLAKWKSKYRDLYDAGKWGPANNAKDSKAKDKNFGKVHMVENTEGGIKICGKGYVLWTFADDNGMYRSLKLPCYYVPTSNTRIASIQELLKTYPNETVTMTDRSLRLSGSRDRHCTNDDQVQHLIEFAPWQGQLMQLHTW